MVRLIPLMLFGAQLIAAGYGVYNEVASDSLLPPGMGLAIAVIAATMSVVLLYAEREREAHQKQLDDGALHRQISNRLSACVTVHEREFYALWPEQVKRAKNNVDITHLGVKPPPTKTGQSEGDYFSELKRNCKSTDAHIRRVERYTPEKKEWIAKLAREFENLGNVSFAVYQDPFTTDMPAALSVCRIDDRYAWLIAIAEHQSTGNFRDLMITGKENVQLIARYFHDRLWSRSVVVIERGQLCPNWESRLKP